MRQLHSDELALPVAQVLRGTASPQLHEAVESLFGTSFSVLTKDRRLVERQEQLVVEIRKMVSPCEVAVGLTALLTVLDVMVEAALRMQNASRGNGCGSN